MQAGLSLCWSHIPHCWKSHAAAHLIFVLDGPQSDKNLFYRRQVLSHRGPKNNLDKVDSLEMETLHYPKIADSILLCLIMTVSEE